MSGRVTDEALWVCGVSRVQHVLPFCYGLRRLAVMHGFGREHGDTAMTMLFVVPIEEGAAEGARIFQAAEPLWKVRPVLKCFELCLRVRVVIGDVRPRVGLLYPQVAEQLCDKFARHRAASIGVEGELPALDTLFETRIENELLGKLRVLSVLDTPADHTTAEDVDNHIEIVVGVLACSLELRNIPAPELIGAGCEQFRPLIFWVPKNPSPLSYGIVSAEQAI